jgi:hypothetical protein
MAIFYNLPGSDRNRQKCRRNGETRIFLLYTKEYQIADNRDRNVDPTQ